MLFAILGIIIYAASTLVEKELKKEELAKSKEMGYDVVFTK